MRGSLASPLSLLLFVLPSLHQSSSDLSEPCPLDQSCVIFVFENAGGQWNYQIHADAQKIEPNMKFLRLHVKPISERTWALSPTTNLGVNEILKVEDILKKKLDWNTIGEGITQTDTDITFRTDITSTKNLIEIFTKEIVQSLGHSEEEKSILTKFWSYTRALLDGCSPTELIITPNEVTCAQKGLKLWVVSDGRSMSISQLKCASKQWKYSLADGSGAELKMSNFVRCSAKDPSSAEPQTDSKKDVYIGCGVALFFLLILAGGAFIFLQRRKKCEKTCPERSTTEGESTVLGVTIDPTKAETKSWRWSDAPSVPSNKDNHAKVTTLSDKGTLSPPDPAATAEQAPKKDTTFINVTESSTIATQSGTEKSKKK